MYFKYEIGIRKKYSQTTTHTMCFAIECCFFESSIKAFELHFLYLLIILLPHNHLCSFFTSINNYLSLPFSRHTHSYNRICLFILHIKYYIFIIYILTISVYNISLSTTTSHLDARHFVLSRRHVNIFKPSKWI